VLDPDWKKERKGMEMKRTVLKTLAVFLALLLGAPQGLIAQSEGEDKPFKQEELDQLLAPIALYPDSLLAQILMASTYPLEVAQAGKWAEGEPEPRGRCAHRGSRRAKLGSERQVAGEFSPGAGHDECEKLDWTQKLGDAFLAQQKDVMDTVQKLRAKAEAEGNLKSSEEQKVVVEKETNTIIIEPSDRGRLCPDLQSDRGLWILVVSIVSALLLLSARIRGRRGLVFFRSGCGHGGCLGLCVGRV
jgi:hypothetical protein